MSTRYVLAEIPYTLEDVRLGSLIPSPNKPNQDAFGPGRRLRNSVDYKWRIEKNPEFRLEEAGKGSVKGDFTKFLRFWAEKTNSRNTTLTAEEGRIYQLVEPKTLFNSLIKGKIGKEWLMRNHDEGENIHFVVGYRTYTDASKKAEATEDSKAGGSAGAPVGEALSDPAAATPSGSALNPKLEGSGTKHRQEKGSSDLPGERIFAICLRRVSFGWFKSKGSPAARMEKDNCWIITSLRGTDGPDAVEVDLEDSFGKESEVVAVNGMDEFVVIKAMEDEEEQEEE